MTKVIVIKESDLDFVKDEVRNTILAISQTISTDETIEERAEKILSKKPSTQSYQNINAVPYYRRNVVLNAIIQAVTEQSLIDEIKMGEFAIWAAKNYNYYEGKWYQPRRNFDGITISELIELFNKRNK